MQLQIASIKAASGGKPDKFLSQQSGRKACNVLVFGCAVKHRMGIKHGYTTIHIFGIRWFAVWRLENVGLST